jgi:hypothetical protein
MIRRCDYILDVSNMILQHVSNLIPQWNKRLSKKLKQQGC